MPASRRSIVLTESWAAQAACTGLGEIINFFPERNEDPRPAQEVCRSCPVKKPCLEHALRTEEVGVWGGATERERRNILLRRRYT